MISQNSVLLLASACLGAIAWWWLSKRWRKSVLRRRFRRAQKAETQAALLLRKKGFKIEAQQPDLDTYLRQDGHEVSYSLRADYLVSKRGKTFVAEVKNGTIAPNPLTPSTRRQLLEYTIAYEADSTLLVDMAQKKIHHISFPIHRPRFDPTWLSPASLWIFGSGVALGIALARTAL